MTQSMAILMGLLTSIASGAASAQVTILSPTQNVECSLLDLAGPANQINLSGPTLKKESFLVNSKAVVISRTGKTFRVADPQTLGTLTADDILLVPTSMGFGDISITNGTVTAMAKSALAFLDTQSRLSLACTLK